ncbi:MAG TPA: hypothetical protein PLU04_14255 [Anaerolineaceae bacterium]|nr:hypothetical protein [Anaerolineaceae bacterium]HOU45480.1 hypothetical protein [Anaerolineaceae bacterium]
MFDYHLITVTHVWERKLEIDEQKRKMRRFEDVFETHPADFHPKPRKKLAFFSWILPRSRKTTPAGCPQPRCSETQPG